jgi:hypothetical protein
VDPRHPVEVSAMTLRILVRDGRCASGMSALGRVEPVDLYADASVVTLAVFVTPLPGDQECPQNPETAVIVELPNAIGAPQLIDAGSYPPMWLQVEGPASREGG